MKQPNAAASYPGRAAGLSDSKPHRPRHRVLGTALLGATAILMGSGVPCGRADEINTLPAAPTPAPQRTLEKIATEVPPYTDNAVAMAPLSPLAAFMGAHLDYSDGIITLTKSFPSSPPGPTTVTIRTGGGVAKVQDAAGSRTVALPMPAEERLQVLFVPLRVVVQLLGGKVERIPEGEITIIHTADRDGVLTPIAQEGYRGADAAHLTITNHVGRALSLRLKGPQNMAVELGRNASIIRALRPGLYYYYAASAGMKTRVGSRRLLAGRKAIWAWGRK